MAQPIGFRSWQDWFDSHIAECEHCAPYLQGEGQMSVEGEESDLDELPYSLGIPERLWAKVIALGSCQGCKASVDGMINVWARSSSEVEFQRKVEGIIRRRGPRLEKFREFLVKHPYLGAGHPTGRVLIKAIGRMKPSSFGGEWYRCIRERGGVPAPDEFRAPDEKQSWPISEGRFNHAGQAHWYLARHEWTAIAEVLDGEGGPVWVQRFSVEDCARVLDLNLPLDGDSDSGASEEALALIMMGSLDSYVERKHAWKPGYMLPRFVMDAAKHAGFQGIHYHSARDSDGRNLVLFDRGWPAEPVGDSIRHEREAYIPPDPVDVPF
jgi:RES domain-containing protein